MKFMQAALSGLASSKSKMDKYNCYYDYDEYHQTVHIQNLNFGPNFLYAFVIFRQLGQIISKAGFYYMCDEHLKKF